MTVNNVDYGPVWIETIKRNYRTTWLKLRLVEAPQRCIETLLDSFHLKVIKTIQNLNVETVCVVHLLQIMKSQRVAFGPIRLHHFAHSGDLTPLQIPPCLR